MRKTIKNVNIKPDRQGVWVCWEEAIGGQYRYFEHFFLQYLPALGYAKNLRAQIGPLNQLVMRKLRRSWKA